VRRLLRFLIILMLLTACAPTVPLRPTAASEVGVTPSIAGGTITPPTARGATPEATTADPPVPPGATEVLTSSPTTSMAVVDQSSVVDPSRAGWWSIKTLGPIGQTFRPTFAGLDAIELWTEDQWDAECSGPGASLLVNLREATIEGRLVGSSSPAVLPDCFKGVTYFGFPALVALTPDKAYVIEVVITSGDNWGVVWQQVPDSYPRGKSIVLGASGDADLWFHAGLRNPTPLTGAYCQNNFWQQVRRTDGSAFSDQADCIQYVTTGP
jgi:hypothetical protein